MRLIPGVLLLAAALAAAACSGSEIPPDGLATTRLSFVGRSLCADCHTRETNLWQGSHHDLAMQEANDSTVLADFDGASITHSGVTSAFFRQDGRFMVRTDGPDGSMQDYPVAYTFGVDPLQQYLIDTGAGRLQALSLAWDTRPAGDGGQRWFHLYPEETIDHTDILHWTGPQQNWNYMCAECHSTDVHKGYYPEEDRYETTWTEIDVSCEACHGPGSAHVEWARNPGDAPPPGLLGLETDLTNSGTWIFDEGKDIARRDPPRMDHPELESCARCHSRRSLISENHVAGMSLLNTHRPALLEENLYHADGQIREEVYVYGSFLQSRMYAAGVSCSDCHEPHSLDLKGSGDGICLQCHLADRFASTGHHHHDPDSQGARCVSCHMPATTYMVVDPRRDHSFRVPRPDVSAAVGSPDACLGCHEDKPAEWGARTIASWSPESNRPRHYGEVLHAGRQHLPGAGADLSRLVADTDTAGIVRATAVTLLPSNPGPGVVDAISSSVGDEDPLVRLAALRALEVFDPRARPLLAGRLLSDPHLIIRTEAARLLAASPRDQLSPDERVALVTALNEYREIQRLNADRASSWMNLGVLATDLGDADRAEAAYRKALEMTTAGPAAAINLADLYRSLQKDAQGEEVLKEGLQRWPDDAGLHHVLGLLLARKGDHAGSLSELEQAALMEPDSPRFVFVFAIALNSAGDTDGALSVLEGAHGMHPGNPQILGALATISRDAGRIEDALVYAHRLVELNPADSQAISLLQSLQRLPN